MKFWRGFTFAFLLECTFRDYLGLEPYLGHVRQYWTPAPFWVWLWLIGALLTFELFDYMAGHAQLEPNQPKIILRWVYFFLDKPELKN